MEGGGGVDELGEERTCLVRVKVGICFHYQLPEGGQAARLAQQLQQLRGLGG